MVCKYPEVLDFVRKYQLLDDLEDEAVQENFEIFSHACKFVKELDVDEIDCDNLDTVASKVLSLLDEAFEHEYTKEAISEIAQAFCKVFDTAGAPKRHVPFIVVMLSRL